MTAARAAGIALLACIGCQAREQAFYERIYPCDSNARADTCGTTRDGKPMTCFAAGQLGGDDFCTEACEPAQAATDPHTVCLASGARLQVCHPHAAADSAWACPGGLECYRTDLLFDEGVCVQMSVCTDDSDCGATRPVCAARLIRERSGASLPIAADHLQCVQGMCGAGKAMCPPGEQCLAGYYDGVTTYDICVPSCDGSLRCPPNFACALSPAASGSPSLCLPGVPGIRCHQEQDCAAGNCVDTGAGFSMCVLPFPCTSNADCAPLNGASSTFLCAEAVAGAGKRCIMQQTFSGTNCVDETDCPAGFICTWYSALGLEQGHGECRLPCGSDGSCPARGGIQHLCVGDGVGGCVPTGFGLACAASSDCLPELRCLPVVPDERSHRSIEMACTTTCSSDADCTGNPVIGGGGFCGTDESVCRVGGVAGDPCERDAQCVHRACAIDASGAGTCAL